MAIGFKDIPMLIMKLVRFSAKTVCKCVHKYPLLSGTLIVFFVLHLFFPSAFVVLVCCVPFLLTGFILFYTTRFRFLSLLGSRTTSKPDGNFRDLPRSVKPDENKNQNNNVGPKLKKPYISAQMSRRRNFRAKIEGDLPPPPPPPLPHDNHQETVKPNIVEEVNDDNLIQRNEKTEEIFKELKREEVPSKKPPDMTSPSPKEEEEAETTLNKHDSSTGGDQVDMLEESDDDDDDDEEEDQAAESINGNNRGIVEWNEVDQKNLMDLGLSEVERNQRLENLIARRRARKFLMAIRGPLASLFEKEENVMASIIAPVSCITKIDHNPSDEIPGSAPSVLLPARNPFDIPYDPTEEKPNLTTVDDDDGFQQEFLLGPGPPHQMICRHESFSTLKPSPFEIYQDSDNNRYMDRIVQRESRFARLRRQAVRGDHDRLIENLLYQQHDDDHPDDEYNIEDEESCSTHNDDRVGPEKESAQQQQQIISKFAKDDTDLIIPTPQTQVASTDHEEEEEEEEQVNKSSDDVKNQIRQQESSSRSSSLIQQLQDDDDQSPPLEDMMKLGGSNIPYNNNGIMLYGTRDSYIDYLNHKVIRNLRHSIASDMQVEVSEASSPTTNVLTPVDLQSPTTSDRCEMDKEINFESQEPPAPNNVMDMDMMVPSSSSSSHHPPAEGTEQEIMGEPDVIEIGGPIMISSSSVGDQEKNSNSNSVVEANSSSSSKSRVVMEEGEYSTHYMLLPSSSSTSIISIVDPEQDEEEYNNNNDVVRDSKKRSCGLFDVVEIPEEAILFVDNSDSVPPFYPAPAPASHGIFHSENPYDQQAAGNSSSVEINDRNAETLEEGKPEEIENQQPPLVEDETDTRNVGEDDDDDDEFRNQTTGHYIISDTRKLEDQDYINPFADSVEVINNNNNHMMGSSSTMSHANGDDDKLERVKHNPKAPFQQLNAEESVEDQEIEEESRTDPPEQVESEQPDKLESRGESQAPPREPIFEQLKSEEPVEEEEVSLAPTEQMTEPVEGIILL